MSTRLARSFKRTSRRIRTVIKINFIFSGMKRTVTESLGQDHYVRYRPLLAILMKYKGKWPQLLEHQAD